ncbi:tripartite tricarboxylate transporter TctB family protein [Rhizobiaceae bacterium n13]|uniref:Tripartite tricarboxylate transporter TctB family protein n=1 Tax=Ferirhizobium litorale TaxID=2927786 RepID=A0AAE3QEL7_9HYPH|nr:tripartite tricarboxylate transporter TctB family protein [Fererhizobium litorale]MDI7861859.1 tripartite tricarboxylate transporter TctB family protein [Fererhizobium litorale]MDI7921799.1 tripartite tricarboxylate transporter TctB family protein [Fererhizobium litorale]
MSTDSSPKAAKRRPDRAALVIAVALIAVAAVIFWDVSRLGAIASYARIGPTTVPNLVAGGLLVLGIWTAIEAWRGDFPEREHQEMGPVLWIVGGLAAQMLLLKPLGFSIATGVLFAMTAAGFGKRKLWLTLPIGIAFSFVVWVIFTRLLQLHLPSGPLEALFF